MVEQWQITWMGDMQRVKLEPGDVVVLHLKQIVADGIMAYQKQALQEIFPDNEVLLLDPRAELEIIGGA